MVRITPTVAVQQITPVPCVLVVVELELILLTSPFEHHSQQHPRPYIESSQFHKHLPFGLSYFSQPWPVHFLIPCFDDPITNPKQVFARICTQNIFCFNLSSLKDGFLSLLVVFLSHDFKLLCGFRKCCLFIL